MRDQDKSPAQWIAELAALRQRVAELEAAQARGASGDLQEIHSRLFEYSGESIFVADPVTLRFLDVNEHAARRLGYSREELLGMTVDEIESPMADGDLDTAAWQSTTSGTIFYECAYRRKDSTLMPAEVSSRMVRHGQREVVLGFVRDVTWRKQLEEERERLIRELQDALAQVKTLSGLLPICANCRRIRDDQGHWHSVEVYIRDRSDAEFSHAICPDCMETLYPEYAGDNSG